MIKSTAVAPWHKFVVDEISAKIKRGKRLNDWEREFFTNIKSRVLLGLGLTNEQEGSLTKLHARMTELTRIKW